LIKLLACSLIYRDDYKFLIAMDQNDNNHSNNDKHPFNSNVARIIGTHISSDNPGPGAYTPIVNNCKSISN
jgi:hypothetical protein